MPVTEEQLLSHRLIACLRYFDTPPHKREVPRADMWDHNVVHSALLLNLLCFNAVGNLVPTGKGAVALLQGALTPWPMPATALMHALTPAAQAPAPKLTLCTEPWLAYEREIFGEIANAQLFAQLRNIVMDTLSDMNVPGILPNDWPGTFAIATKIVADLIANGVCASA